jgi:hypothetical protein
MGAEALKSEPLERETLWDYDYKYVCTAVKAMQQVTGLERLCIESNLHVNYRTIVIA